MRVEEVDDGDGQADHEAEGSGDYDEPEAPAELEGELRGVINGNFKLLDGKFNKFTECVRTCTSSMWMRSCLSGSSQ